MSLVLLADFLNGQRVMLLVRNMDRSRDSIFRTVPIWRMRYGVHKLGTGSTLSFGNLKHYPCNHRLGGELMIVKG